MEKQPSTESPNHCQKHPHSVSVSRGQTHCPAQHNCRAPLASPGLRPTFLLQKDNEGEGEAGEIALLITFYEDNTQLLGHFPGTRSGK